MAMISDDIDSSTLATLELTNLIFTALFCAEAIFKIFVMNIGPYFKNGWNRLDMIVVISSLIDIIINEVIAKYVDLSNNTIVVKIFKIIRVLRIIKLVKSMEGLKKLVGTIIFSLPSLINASSLIFLSYYIFSILASFLF
jgi:voltage-dependent calcium channel T type alpha-1I